MILGLQVQYTRPLVTDLIEATREVFVSVVLVHVDFVHSLNIASWVVVTSVHVKSVIVSDPYPPNGQEAPCSRPYRV